MINSQALQTAVAGGDHVIGPPVNALKAAVGSAHVSKFRGQHGLFAAALQRAAYQFFIAAHAVHVRGIQEIHPAIESAMNGRDGFGFVDGSVELRHAHASQPQRGNAQRTQMALRKLR